MGRPALVPAQPGERLEGSVLAVEECDGPHGSYLVVTLLTPDGQSFAVISVSGSGSAFALPFRSGPANPPANSSACRWQGFLTSTARR